MKYLTRILVGTVALSLFVLLASYTEKLVPVADSNNPEDYLSISVHYEQVPYDEETGYHEYVVTIYDYDLQTKELKEVYNFPYNTQYALGVYDKKEDVVYYTKEKSNNTYQRMRTGDQIYMYDLKTGVDTMLTEDLFAVNYVIPAEDAIFFVAARMSHTDGLTLGKVDLKDGSVYYWDEDDSASVQTISVDKVNQRIYVSIFDWIERDHSMTMGNMDGIYIPPRYAIYSFDYNLEDKREILHMDHMEINTMYARDNWLLYRSNKDIFTIETTEVLDLGSMSVIFQVEDYLKPVGNFTRDKKGVYTKLDAGDSDGIYYYDFETKEFTPIVIIDFAFFNFQVMYYE